MALTKTIQEFPALYGSDVVDEIAFASQIAWNLNSEEAHTRAQELLAASPGDYSGTRLTCILSWSFADESLWRGLTDNKKLVRLMRSMILTGFQADEPLRSRTFDRSADDCVFAAQRERTEQGQD